LEHLYLGLLNRIKQKRILEACLELKKLKHLQALQEDYLEKNKRNLWDKLKVYLRPKNNKLL
jgi:hypothetical protein